MSKKKDKKIELIDREPLEVVRLTGDCGGCCVKKKCCKKYKKKGKHCKKCPKMVTYDARESVQYKERQHFAM